MGSNDRPPQPPLRAHCSGPVGDVKKEPGQSQSVHGKSTLAILNEAQLSGRWPYG